MSFVSNGVWYSETRKSNPIDLEKTGVVATNLKFPNDLPKYYSKIEVYEYNRSPGSVNIDFGSTMGNYTIVNPITGQTGTITQDSNFAGGVEDATIPSMFGGVKVNLNVKKTNRISSIRLPIPGQLTDSQGVSLGSIDASGFLKGGATIFSSALGGVSQALGLGSETGQGIVEGVSEVAATAAQYTAALSGVALNTFSTITFQGPQYKNYTMTWRLSPRNKKESDEIQNIIYVIKNNSLPKMIGDNTIFLYPRVFKLSMMMNDKENPYLFEFRPAFVSQVSVSYSNGADGIGFYKDTGAPLFVDVSIHFQEIEYFLRKDDTSSTSSNGDTKR